MISSYGLFVIGLLIGCLAMLSDVIAIAIPWWTYKETEMFGEILHTRTGLWESCLESETITGESTLTCSKIIEPKEYESTTQTLLVIGLLLMGLSMVVTSAYTFFLTQLHMLSILGFLCMTLAGFMIWVGVIFYGFHCLDIPGNTPGDFHAGWGLALASSLLCFTSAPLFAASKIRRHR